VHSCAKDAPADWLLLSRWLVDVFRLLTSLVFRLTTTIQCAGTAEGGRFMCHVCGLSHEHADSMAIFLFQLLCFGRINSSSSSETGDSWT